MGIHQTPGGQHVNAATSGLEAERAGQGPIPWSHRNSDNVILVIGKIESKAVCIGVVNDQLSINSPC
jgi:hypothetical protein